MNLSRAPACATGPIALKDLLPVLPIQEDIHSVFGSKGGKGDSKNSSRNPVTLNAFNNSSGTLVPDPGESTGIARGNDSIEAVDNEQHAVYIADAFDDMRSLAWYRLVLRVVPREVVWDAFVRARDLTRSNVRRSRAALFTSIVRHHVDSRRPLRRRPPTEPTAARVC